MTNLVDIRIPGDQHEGTELEMGAWLKAVGDRVEKDEPIAELVTDKAVVELPAPVSGTLAEIRVETDSRIEDLDTVLGRIATDGAAPVPKRTAAPKAEARPAPRSAGAAAPAPGEAASPAASAPPAEARTDRPRAHPAVARLARLHGVELDRIEGSGAGGRVTSADLRAVLGSARSEPENPAPRPRNAPAADLGPSRVVRHDPMRRSIARNLAESVRTAPHVTAVFECDLGRVIADRDARKAALAEDGVKLTFSAYFILASVRAIRAVPEVNARWHDDGLEIFESVHVGVGTALEDRGLVVPVVRDAHTLDLEGAARALTLLTEKARAGKLTPADMRGSTFTISNHGVMGSLMASPIIIQPPESAILGIGKLERRPTVVEGDRIEPRPKMYVTLTIDHRALDAFHTNRFLTTFCETLEGWS